MVGTKHLMSVWRQEDEEGGFTMLYIVAGVLFVLWLLGFSMHVGGGLIHALLVIAVIVVVFNLLSGRRTLG
jgi:hypothetical protein